MGRWGKREHRDAAGESALELGTGRTVAGLATIAVVALGVLALAWWNAPDSRSLWEEVATTSLQVIAVAVVGGVASLITFSYQQQRLDAAKEREIRRDERSRADELVRSTLEATLRSYNQVKRTRRLLDADTRRRDHREISLDDYDQHLRALIDQQLAFEEFTRSAFQIDAVIERLHLHDPTGDPATSRSLSERYASIEKYLNKVIKEYKRKRHLVVASPGGVALDALPELTSLIGHRFVEQVSDEMDEVLAALRGALLQPMRLPHG